MSSVRSRLHTSFIRFEQARLCGYILKLPIGLVSLIAHQLALLILFLIPFIQDASASIADLQTRLQDLELAKKHDNAAAVLQKERTEMLMALRQIMAALKSESKGAMGSVCSNKEMVALKAENEELKKINAKQKYRIEHLVHNLKAVTDEVKH